LRKFFPLFVALTLTLLACSEDPVITDWRQAEIPVVLSMISPAFKRVKVYVGRSFPESQIQPMRGARVTIEGRSEKVELSEWSEGVYMDSSLTIEHDQTYYLRVETPSGKVLTAQTTVPGEFFILNISSGDTLPYLRAGGEITRPKICWSHSRGAVVYLCLFQLHTPHLSTAPVVTLDTLSYLPPLYPWADTPQTLQTKLAIFAFDSAFSHYGDWNIVRTTEGGIWYWETLQLMPSAEQYFDSLRSLTLYERSNIFNGVGVFGSAAIKVIDVIIRFTYDH